MPHFCADPFTAKPGSPLKIMEVQPVSQNRHNRVKKAILYIESNYTEKITAADIAASAHLSRFHFIRLFRGTTGLTPMEFVTKLRLDKAKNLLLTTGMSLAIVALACGFSSQSHFTRAFRSHHGLTPGQFRKTVPPVIQEQS